MPQEFTIACPQCGAEYDIPTEYIGETAQCAECECEFEIPPLEKGKNPHETQTLDVEIRDQIVRTTKLSRKTYGMIPDLDERKKSFEFGDKNSEER